MEIVLADLAATEALGCRIAAMLRPGMAVLLSGPLGAGKTALARALLRAACADPTMTVPSPSYTLVQSYRTPDLTIHHFDLWRLDGPAGLEELGWEAALADVVLVEWPERLGDGCPAGAIRVEIAVTGPASRVATVTGLV